MLERKRTFYDVAVAKLESIRRRLARQAEIEQLAILTDEDQVNVALAKRELDDSLARAGESSLVRAMEVEDVLKEALGE
jgi:multidrug efflux pump subunit AcrA (membrane-fusion protein)